jgi:xanthine/uracil permease
MFDFGRGLGSAIEVLALLASVLIGVAVGAVVSIVLSVAIDAGWWEVVPPAVSGVVLYMVARWFLR